MLVLFHTPAVPFETTISPAKTKLQSSDSYQPRDRGDHSNKWTLIGEGSMPRTSLPCIASKAAAVSLDDPVLGILGASSDISMRTVCSGNSGSQLSI